MPGKNVADVITMAGESLNDVAFPPFKRPSSVAGYTSKAIERALSAAEGSTFGDVGKSIYESVSPLSKEFETLSDKITKSFSSQMETDDLGLNVFSRMDPSHSCIKSISEIDRMRDDRLLSDPFYSKPLPNPIHETNKLLAEMQTHMKELTRITGETAAAQEFSEKASAATLRLTKFSMWIAVAAIIVSVGLALYA